MNRLVLLLNVTFSVSLDFKNYHKIWFPWRMRNLPANPDWFPTRLSFMNRNFTHLQRSEYGGFDYGGTFKPRWKSRRAICHSPGYVQMSAFSQFFIIWRRNSCFFGLHSTTVSICFRFPHFCKQSKALLLVSSIEVVTSSLLETGGPLHLTSIVT